MTYAFDPEIAAAIPALPQGDYRDLAGGRAGLKELLTAVIAQADTSGVSVRDESVPVKGAPDVPVRVYTPDRIVAPSLLLNVHGGGFTHGDLDADHVDNLALARDLGVVIVSVGYRLAPESPYPAALDDCYAALEWAGENAARLGAGSGRLVIHGVSAGAGLCAALALLARDRGGPAISFQFLCMPELDDRLDSTSMRAFTDTPLWNRPNAEYSWECYLGPLARGGADVPAYAAPARATDLAGLPPAYVSVMEFDPMRDEGIAYAQALLAAGVQTELHLFPGTFHGSLVFRHAQVVQREMAEKHAVLTRALGTEI